MTTAETGRKGEQAAADYLRREGYDLESLNWRNGRYELDIVARKWDTLHFVEVKTRRADGLTPPEDAMTRRKQQAMLCAAKAYLAYTQWEGEVAFDLIAVDVWDESRVDLRLIPDAVEYNW